VTPPLGRKERVLYVCLAMATVASFVLDPTKLSTLVLGIGSLAGLFFGSHAATDVMARKNEPKGE
jgi:hypothetical protein